MFFLFIDLILFLSYYEEYSNIHGCVSASVVGAYSLLNIFGSIMAESYGSCIFSFLREGPSH